MMKIKIKIKIKINKTMKTKRKSNIKNKSKNNIKNNIKNNNIIKNNIGCYKHFIKNIPFQLIFYNTISTKRRRYYKIRKHQKKKYKKKRMGLSTIPWVPTKEKVRTYKMPNESRLINKRFMRDKKGGRRYRLKKQR